MKAEEELRFKQQRKVSEGRKYYNTSRLGRYALRDEQSPPTAFCLPYFFFFSTPIESTLTPTKLPFRLCLWRGGTNATEEREGTGEYTK